MSVELRRMAIAGMSLDQRKETYRIMLAARREVDARSRPAVAADFDEWLDLLRDDDDHTA